MSDEIKFITYFKTDNCDISFRTYNCCNDSYETIFKLPTDISNFYLPKNSKKYVTNDADLKRYAIDLKADRDELLQYTTFDYIQPYKTPSGKFIYRTHNKCIESFFNMLCKGVDYDMHERITIVESKWMEKCNNGALQYCKKGQYTCHGYDHKRYYQSLMIHDDFVIPYKEGKEQKWTYLIDEKTKRYRPLMVGYYNVFISSDNETFNKIFCYSSEHVYSHFSLKFAIKYQQKYNVKIELNLDCEKNCYVYEKKICMPFKQVCKTWSEKLDMLKGVCPSNGILKMLSSTMWGVLSKKKKYTKTMQQIEDEGLEDEIGHSYNLTYHITKMSIPDDNGYYFYRLVKTDEIYYYNFRLKSFLTSFGRSIMAEALIQLNCLDDTIYINTDGFVTTKEVKNYSSIPHLIPDTKHSGNFEIVAVNKPFIPI